jgi:hypothetical protein
MGKYKYYLEVSCLYRPVMGLRMDVWIGAVLEVARYPTSLLAAIGKPWRKPWKIPT